MQLKKSSYYLMLLLCVCSRSYSNSNTYEHPSFGLSITKPDSWEFLNPNEIRARISAAKLEDESIQMFLQTQMEPPLVEIEKDINQPISPQLTITINKDSIEDVNSPIDLIKRASRHAPQVFKDYTIVDPPKEVQIAGQTGAYMKAHYTGQLVYEEEEYPLQYETWILPGNSPEKRYHFMIGVTALRDLNNQDRDEVASMIKSLKFVNDSSVSAKSMTLLLRSQFYEATQNKYKFEDCLQLAKPYGMWDIRPRGIGHLDIGGEVAKPNHVSWLQLGLLSAHFKLSRENGYQEYTKWFENIAEINAKFKTVDPQKKAKLNALAEIVKKSNHKIYISHKMFKRVDELFCHDGKFWKYDIPLNSCFEISDKKQYSDEASYDDKDQEILNQLDKLGCYGVVKHDNTIIIIIDGLVSSSYGYIFAPSEIDLMCLVPLYDIQDLHKLNSEPDCYFYFSK